jgi:hypothetical protein
LSNQTWIRTAFYLVAAVWALLLQDYSAEAADKENCLMCHRYRYLGRIDEKGRLRNYQVDEVTYFKSLHRAIACRDCHFYIKKFPHDPVTEEVNCSTQCHILPPHAEEKFSHERIAEIYSRSVHAIRPGDTPEQSRGKPQCKYCHLNPVYERVDQERIDFDETLRRCLNCHHEKGVTQAYKHVTHRLRKKTSRSPQEIVGLCGKCHDDQPLMKKYDVSEKTLTAVKTYKNSIHGKAVVLGSQAAADCISCHASSALHDIYKKENRDATINKDNLEKVCKQCHVGTNERFIQIAVHPVLEKEHEGVLGYIGVALKFALYGITLGLIGLMLSETYRRKKGGIKWQLRRGTTWRGIPRRKAGK